MVDGNKMNISVVGEFVSAFYFSKYCSDENGVKMNYYATKVADKVIVWVDRDIAPLNDINCRKIKADLLLENIDISQNVTTECAYAMQRFGMNSYLRFSSIPNQENHCRVTFNTVFKHH
jgi:hypothetical protein